MARVMRGGRSPRPAPSVWRCGALVAAAAMMGGRPWAAAQPTPIIASFVTGLASPAGLALHPADGSLLIVESGGGRVRRQFANGTLTVWAGGGSSAADGVAATTAALPTPSYLAVKGAAVLVTVYNDHRVRRVDAAGVITTVAGTGARGFTGDGGPATAAQIGLPLGVAVSPVTGDVYFSDSSACRVRRVDAAGVVTTVAGAGCGYTASGPATACQLNAPYGVGVLPDGTLVFADNMVHRVRRVGVDGMLSNMGGTGGGWNGDGLASVDTNFAYPNSITVTADGAVLVTDWFHRLRRIAPTTTITTTVAGSATTTSGSGFAGDGGAATAARLAYPSGSLLHPTWGYLVADYNNGCVRRVAEAAVVVTAFDAAPARGVGAVAVAANLTLPSSVPAGTCFVSLTAPAPLAAQFAAAGFRVTLTTAAVAVACAAPVVTVDAAACAAVNASCCAAVTWACDATLDAGAGWLVNVTYVPPGGGAGVAFPAPFGLRYTAPLTLTATPAGTPPSPALPAGVTPANVTLCGANMGAALAAVAPATLYWTPASQLLAAAFINATCVATQWNMAADPLPWLYWPVPLSYTVAAATVVATPPLLPVAVTPNATAVAWGDVLTLTAPFLGTVLTGAAVTVSAGNVSLPCSDAQVVSQHVWRCTLRYVATAWVGLPLAFTARPAGRAASVPLGVTPAVTFTGAAAGAVTPMTTSWSSQSLVIATLPHLPSAAALAADSVAAPLNASLLALRGWLGSLPATCAVVAGADTAATCSLPVGASLADAFTLEVGGVFNVSAAVVATMGRVAASPPAVAWGARLTLTGTGLGALPVASLALLPHGAPAAAALPCAGAAAVNASTVTCTVRLLRAAWHVAALPLNVLLTYVNSSQPRRLLADDVALVAAPATAAAALAATNVSDTVRLVATLPAPALTAAEAAAYGQPANVTRVRALLTGNLSLAAAVGAGTAAAGSVVAVTCAASAGGVATVVCDLPATAAAVPPADAGDASLPLTLELAAGSVLLTLARTVMAAPAAAPAALAWGDTLAFDVPAAAAVAAPLTAVALGVTTDVASQLPCTSPAAAAAAAGATTITCTLRYLRQSWLDAGAGAPQLAALVTYTVDTPPVLVLLPAGVRITPPALAAATVAAPDAWLARRGNTTVAFTLPAAAWSAAELAPLQVTPPPPPACTAWLAGVPAGSCTWTSATTGVVAAPALWLPATTLTVSLSGLLNLSSTPAMALAYEPPAVTAVTPATLYAAAASTPHVRNVTLAFSGADMRPVARYLSAVAVGGVPCTLAADVASDCDVAVPCTSTITCHGLALHTALAAAPPSDARTAPVAVTYTWAARAIASPPLATLVRRPAVTSLRPADVQTGAALILFGEELAPAEACADAVNITVGGVPCATTLAQPTVAACTVPAPRAGAAATVPVVVTSCLGLASTENVSVVYPSAGTVTPAGALPLWYLPSTLATPAALDGSLVFALARPSGAAVTSAACSLTSSNPAAIPLPLSIGSLNAVAANASGSVDFGRVIVTGPHGAALRLTVTCTSDVVSFPPVAWDVAPAAPSVEWCVPPPPAAASQAGMAAWSVAVVLPPPAGVAAPAGGALASAGCAAPADGAARLLPAVLPAAPPAACVATGAPSGVTLEGANVVTGAAGTAVFAAFVVSGVLDTVVSVSVTCSLYGVALPHAVTAAIAIPGCAPGAAPFQGTTCVPCGAGTFGVGGMANCTACPPDGVVCASGRATLLPGYYRPPAAAAAALAADTELLPCYNSEACTLNASAAAYGCAVGYTGPLCGVCDADAGYAAFGAACAACPSPDASRALLALFVVLFVAALAAVALRKSAGQRAEASIALRILLTFVQAVSSLRALRAAGRKAYYSIVGGVGDAVSANPMSLGPIQCLLRQTYASQYIFVLALPALAGAGVVAIFVALAGATSVRWTPRPHFDAASFRARVAAWYAERRHVAALLFVAQLAYMPAVNASLRALDCVPGGGGASYLRADLRIECSSTGAYAGLAALAVAALVLMGVGFPVVVFVSLRRAAPAALRDATFRATWGFLYDGYRLPPVPHASAGGAVSTTPPAPQGKRGHSRGNFVWWEAVVLLRKAGIVLLAVLVQEPQTQIVGATLWLGLHLTLHARFSPYSRPLFNALELTSLAVLFVNAALSGLLLPPAGVAAASNDDATFAGLSVRQVGVTATLLLLNVAVVAGLAVLWMVLQVHRVRTLVSGKLAARAAAKQAGAGGAGAGEPPTGFTLNPLRQGARASATSPPASVGRVLAAAAAGAGGAAMAAHNPLLRTAAAAGGVSDMLDCHPEALAVTSVAATLAAVAAVRRASTIGGGGGVGGGGGGGGGVGGGGGGGGRRMFEPARASSSTISPTSRTTADTPSDTAGVVGTSV